MEGWGATDMRREAVDFGLTSFISHDLVYQYVSVFLGRK